LAIAWFSYARDEAMSMPKTGHTEEEILRPPRDVEAGETGVTVWRKYGISQQTLYRGKKQDAGLGRSELQEIRQLREEKRRRKRSVADLRLDRYLLQDLVAQKARCLGLGALGWRGSPPSTRRASGEPHRGSGSVGPRSGSSPRRDPPPALRICVWELAGSRMRFGSRRLTELRRREGWPGNAKQRPRLDPEEVVLARTTPQHRAAPHQRVPRRR
jgi:putative transposase